MLREPRREIIGVRVTLEEKEIIKKKCRELGYDNLSECIRSLIEKHLKKSWNN